jgi:NADPH2:quinone reductase
MQAVRYNVRGPAREVLSLVAVPDPEPGPGEVRVKVMVSAVNPSDTKGRGNWMGATAMAFPSITPHQDGSGIIDAVGQGVDASRIGERVWVYMAQRGRPFGTAAEYTLVPSERAVRLPDNATFADGASLGIPAMTAHAALFLDGPIEGKTVLIQGAAGAVGFYAVQLAKWGGAKQVLATVSRDEQAKQARLAGADAIINRKTEDVVARIRELSGREAGVDRIIEVNFGANQAISLAVLATNGTIAAYASDSEHQPILQFYPFLMKNATLRTVLIYEVPQAARERAARDIVRLLEAGYLKHQVAARFSLDQTAAAHEAMESGASVGKVLVDVAV